MHQDLEDTFRESMADSHINPALNGRLATNTLYSFAGNVAQGGFLYLIFVIIAKTSSQSDLGLYALGFAVSKAVVLLVRFELPVALQTDTHNEFSPKDYLGLLLSLGVVGILATSATGLFYSTQIDSLLLFAVLSVMQLVDSVFDLTYALYAKEGAFRRIAQSRILRSLSGLLLFVIARHIGETLPVSLLFVIAGWGIVFWVHDASTLRRGCSPAQLQAMRGRMQLFRRCLPLGAVMFLFAINKYMPQYLIPHYLDMRLLGIYSALFFPFLLAEMVVRSSANAIISRLSVYAQDSLWKTYIANVRYMLLAFFVLGIACIFISHYFGALGLETIYDASYRPYAPHLTLLACVMTLNFVSQGLGIALTALRRFRLVLLSYSIVPISSVLALVILLPRLNLIGAIVAIAISSAIFAIICLALLFWIIRKRIADPLERKK